MFKKSKQTELGKNKRLIDSYLKAADRESALAERHNILAEHHVNSCQHYLELAEEVAKKQKALLEELSQEEGA